MVELKNVKKKSYGHALGISTHLSAYIKPVFVCEDFSMAQVVLPTRPVIGLDRASDLDNRVCSPSAIPLIKEPAFIDISEAVSPSRLSDPREISSPEPLSISQTLPYGDAAMSPGTDTSQSDISMTSQSAMSTQAYTAAINSLVSQGLDLPGLTSLQSVSSNFQLLSGSTMLNSTPKVEPLDNNQNIQPMNLSAVSNMSPTSHSTEATSPTSKSSGKGKLYCNFKDLSEL